MASMVKATPVVNPVPFAAVSNNTYGALTRRIDKWLASGWATTEQMKALGN